MNIRGLLGAAMLAAFAMAPQAHAQAEVKFGHVGEPGSLMDLSATEFAKRANEKLGDKAEAVSWRARAMAEAVSAESKRI